MPGPRVLLVDDQRQVTRMLRTSLELSGRPYDITVVASAEEALLELGRGPIDMVVTDLRLPGMTGLELLARIRQTNPNLRAILITGQPTPEVRAQAQALGVVAFLPKPVGTGLFLQAVDRALAPGSPAAAPELTGDRALLAEKLMTMRRELGARASFLVHRSGGYVMRAGEINDSQLDEVIGNVMESFGRGLEVSVAMGAEAPRNFLHVDGQPYRLYLTNVGREHALLVAFRGEQEPWQMGAIFHYARRLADEILPLVPALAKLAASQAPTRPPAGARPAAPAPVAPPAPAARQAESLDAASFWEQAAADSSGQAPGQGEALSYEQARKLGLMPEEPSE
ncbi:MAG TPA: response regulator [Anaerolineales bacterium]|nr:response regulator [Anaerolineales bacterium]